LVGSATGSPTTFTVSLPTVGELVWSWF